MGTSRATSDLFARSELCGSSDNESADLVRAVEEDRHAVGHVRHLAEEEAALGDEQRALHRSVAQARERVREIWKRRGDVALRRHETGHAVRALEAVDVLTLHLAPRHAERGD